MINTAKKIKQKRLELGMTQNELEELTGIEYSRISRVENGSIIPDINELFLLSRAFDCEICDLIPCGYNQGEREFMKVFRSLSRSYIRRFSTYAKE